MKYYKLFFFILIQFLLILPLFDINTDEITKQENRVLKRFPQKVKKGKLNYEFGKEFESWLGDRFWGRDQLIDARFQTIYKVNGRIENSKAFVGDDGWMFEKNTIVNLPSLEKQREKIEKDADILKRFDDKFKEKNIPIYLVLIPDRNLLYQKYWEKYYTPKPRLDYNEELIKALQDHPNIHIIYPKNEFIEAMKIHDLFYKDDGHLTKNGKFLLLNKLDISLNMNELDQNIKAVKKVKNYTDSYRTNIAAYLKLYESTKENIKVYSLKYPDFAYQELENKSFFREIEDFYGAGDRIVLRSGTAKNPLNDKTIFSIGICYSEMVYNLYKGLFKNQTWFRTNVPSKKAKIFVIAQIKSLYDLKPTSSIIVLIPDSTTFQAIKESL